MLVPVLPAGAGPTFFSPLVAYPRSNSILYTRPSRRTSASHHSDSAFIAFAPMPCSPAEVW